jgi:hypothetical protein
MSFDPLLTVLGLTALASATVPTTFAPTAVRAAVRIAPTVLPSAPAAGDLAIDSGDSNKFKWWDGSAWQTAGGGGGTPGGSDTQLQYNNAGAFGGTSGLTWNATDKSLLVTGTITKTTSTNIVYVDIINYGALGAYQPIIGVRSVTQTVPNAAVGLDSFVAGAYLTGIAQNNAANYMGALTVYGVRSIAGAVLAHADAIAKMIGLSAEVSIGTSHASGTVTVTDVFNIRTETFLNESGAGSTTVTNFYGLYITALTLNNVAVTNRYGIYQADTDAKNVLLGQTETAASVAGHAGFRIPHGVAPTSPVDGDFWSVTTTGLFTRFNGATSLITLNLGVPSAEAGDRTLTNADNAKNLICSGSRTFTVNTGLTSGFGCSFKGTVSFTGTATVTDVRTTGATNPWCALCQTGTDTYDIVGSKL